MTIPNRTPPLKADVSGLARKPNTIIVYQKLIFFVEGLDKIIKLNNPTINISNAVKAVSNPCIVKNANGGLSAIAPIKIADKLKSKPLLLRTNIQIINIAVRADNIFEKITGSI